MKICHVITGLQSGGCERSLYNLVSRGRELGLTHCVIALTSGGPYKMRLQDIGVEVCELSINKKNVFSLISCFFFALRFVRDVKPDVLHGWMYHGNFFALLLNSLLPQSRMVWGIRQALDDPRSLKLNTALISKILAKCSGRATYIVANSHRSRAQHIANGYKESNFLVIPNGIDLSVFRPREEVASLRKALGLPFSEKILGFVGRNDSAKDIKFLLASLAEVHKVKSNVSLVLVGVEAAPELLSVYAHKVYFVGFKSNVEEWYSIFDLFCLFSSWEGCPNALLEAMASGVICLTSNVGDCGLILDGVGEIFYAKNETKVAKQICEQLDKDLVKKRQSISAGMYRVRKHYSIDGMYNAYKNVYAEMVK